MLFSTSLLLFVGAGEQPELSPRKLTLLNTDNNTIIQNLCFPSTILSILLNRKRLCIILDMQAHVYDLDSLQLLRIVDTGYNKEGVGALSICIEKNSSSLSSPSSLLALPATKKVGAIMILDTLSNTVDTITEIQAHKSDVALLAWNDEGTLLASASTKGTVIRVFQMPRCTDREHQQQQYYAFRRGTTTANITSIVFTPSDHKTKLLCVASDHGTVHIYRLGDAASSSSFIEQKQQGGGRGGLMRQPTAGALLNAMLPNAISSAVEPSRDVATVRLPGKTALPCMAAVASPGRGDDDGGDLWLYVARADRVLFKYRIQGLGFVGSKKKDVKYVLVGQYYFSNAGP
jgi:autophagy-related protein 18